MRKKFFLLFLFVLFILSGCENHLSKSTDSVDKMVAEETTDMPAISEAKAVASHGAAENEIRLTIDFPVYPPQEVSETVVELVRLAQRLKSCGFDYMLRHSEGKINIEWYDIMAFKPYLFEYSLNDEEYRKYSEKYELGVEGFIDIAIVDNQFYEIFANDTLNINPAYRENATIENGTLLWYGIVHAGESNIPVLKEQVITDDGIELIFAMLFYGGMKDELHGKLEYGDTWTKWGDPIGRIEDDEYILFGDAMDNMSNLKYTFILENGKYKIYAIELA